WVQVTADENRGPLDHGRLTGTTEVLDQRVRFVPRVERPLPREHHAVARQDIRRRQRGEVTLGTGPVAGRWNARAGRHGGRAPEGERQVAERSEEHTSE